MEYSMSRWAMFIAAVGVVAVFTIGSPEAVQAQTIGMEVNIPFEFQVGDQVLSPGRYTVWLRGNGSAIAISDDRGKTALSLVNAVPRTDPRSDVSLLVFTVYGNRYFLHEVRLAGYPSAKSLLKSKTETTLAKAMPATDVTKASVAANREK
jgi:hypothetical protein